MRLSLNSLGVRIGLIFLVGLIALQAALAVVVFWPGGPGRPIFNLVGPEDAAAMAEALEAAPPGLQPALVRALNMDATVVRLEPDFPVEDLHKVRDAPRLERRFARYAAALEGRPFRVQTQLGARVQGLGEGGFVAAGPVRLLVELRNGQVLVIERTTPTAVRRFVNRAALLGAISLAILGGVFVAAVWQAARPVAGLATGARRLADDLSTPDFPERGAREIKDLAAAFNHMKRTIRRLMDERTRVLAAIAHDLRTYLTRLRLRADFIDDPDQRARAIADLDEMGLLLDDTLTFAREATGGRRDPAGPLDVRAEVANLVALRRELGEAVEDGSQACSGLAAECAPVALRRMLANLTDNAVRYGGGARLTAERTDEHVVVRVEDEGPGAPPEALAGLTEPFRRLEPSRGRGTGGAGLGLAIVKALAESQGGSLELENRAEGGLRATLRLKGSVLPVPHD